jgi:hypothetical protein
MVMERVKLMYETDQMNWDTYRDMPSIIRKIEDYLQVKLAEENGGACITHLAKAVQRIKDNRLVTECSPELLEQAKANASLFNFSSGLLSPYNAHEADLEAESAFMASYFMMMVEEEM